MVLKIFKSKSFWMPFIIFILLSFIIGFYWGYSGLMCDCPFNPETGIRDICSCPYFQSGLIGGFGGALFLLIPSLIFSWGAYFIIQKFKK
ncbi:hypothetical protein GOV13_03855 [Candidatus Pacearchaeota archaeon]|nr:hypothetical protein [Candidatus Pacearchaeota archaeon]